MKLRSLLALALAVAISACARASHTGTAQTGAPPQAQAPAQKPTAPPVTEIPSAQLEKELFKTVNDTRAQNGLKPLALSVGLAKSARQHSEAMASGSFLSTRLAGEQSVLDRMSAVGVSSKTIGENVLRLGAQPDQVVAETISTWLGRDANRKNLLSSAFARTGIAIARGNEGDYYITEDFAE